MKVNVKKIILIIIIFIFVLAFLQTISFADTIYINKYKTTLTTGDAAYLFTKGGKILKVLRNVAAIVCVISISIIGFRYMIGSTEQKAEYKQTMIPVVIGTILIGTLSTILTIIQSIV